ncbi:MAG: FecR domain-containing protein [Candidatus Eremiobacteraeota bacterium]|nr:FecR domain-containing protein [Candidatus Eremiobacteraeota bacterium]
MSYDDPLTQEEERLFTNLQGLLSEVVEPELPEGFTRRFRARLDRLESGQDSLDETPALWLGETPKVVVLDKRQGGRSWVRPFLAAAAVVLMVFGVSLWLSREATPPGEPAQAMLAHADAPVELASGSSDRQVSETTALEPGTVITTQKDNFGVVVLGEESNQVRFGEDTVVKVNKVRRYLRDNKRLEGEFELARGRLWVTEKSARLAVRTPNAILIPVGTEYEAHTGADGTEVVVWEGEVIARSLDGQHAVHIRQGEELSLDKRFDWSPRRVMPIREGREKTPWHLKNRRLRLLDRPGLRHRLSPAPMDDKPRALPGLRRRLQQLQTRPRPALPESAPLPKAAYPRRQPSNDETPRIPTGRPRVRERIKERLSDQPSYPRRRREQVREGIRERVQNQRPGLRRQSPGGATVGRPVPVASPSPRAAVGQPVRRPGFRANRVRRGQPDQGSARSRLPVGRAGSRPGARRGVPRR